MGSRNMSFSARTSSTVYSEQTIYSTVVLPGVQGNESDLWQQKQKWLVEQLENFYQTATQLYTEFSTENTEWQKALENPEEELNNLGYPASRRYLWKPNKDTDAQVLKIDAYVLVVVTWLKQQFEQLKTYEVAIDPDDFLRFKDQRCKKICSRIFRLFAIMYCNPKLNGNFGTEELMTKFNNTTQERLQNTFKRFAFFGWYWRLLVDLDWQNVCPVFHVLRRRYVKEKQRYESNLNLFQAALNI
eukprot:maker-scaffold_58-snap-gene-0.17-mRNA-1 protein AED:0.26 eAED:0.26 QI:23/1/1/1/0.5/0.66/3/493/243